METVFSIVRKIYERKPADKMEDLDVNAAVWGIFQESSLEQLFYETRRLIRDQTEIIGVKTIDFKERMLRSTSLLCSRAYQITNAKTYILSDCSALCGKDGR